MCHWCSYHILTSSVVYYWTNARQHGIYLVVLYSKEPNYHRTKNYFKNFQQSRALPRSPPTLTNTKKPFDVHVIYCLYIWSNLIGPRKSYHRLPLSNLTQASLLVDWKLTAKAELNCEIYKSRRKCWKNRDSFCHQSSPVSWTAWTLPRMS